MKGPGNTPGALQYTKEIYANGNRSSDNQSRGRDNLKGLNWKHAQYSTTVCPITELWVGSVIKLFIVSKVK